MGGKCCLHTAMFWPAFISSRLLNIKVHRFTYIQKYNNRHLAINNGIVFLNGFVSFSIWFVTSCFQCLAKTNFLLWTNSNELYLEGLFI